jgi:D-lactate dehydrogenase
LKYDALIFLDSIELISEYLLPKLKIVKSNKKVILHPNCSSVKMDLDKKLISIAEEICEQVEVPDNLGCCGMSGDRGLMYPDLTTSATKAEAEEVVKVDYDGYYSTNIPCEIGMSSATNKLYKSIIYLVDEATK